MIRPQEERQGRERQREGEGAEGRESEREQGGGGWLGWLEKQTKPEREKWDEEPDRGVDREMEQLKRGRQLGPARTEQLLRPISSSTRPRHSLA